MHFFILVFFFAVLDKSYRSVTTRCCLKNGSPCDQRDPGVANEMWTAFGHGRLSDVYLSMGFQQQSSEIIWSTLEHQDP